MLGPYGYYYKSAAAAFHLARQRRRQRLMLTTSSLHQVFLHVGPSGDCWTGSSIYAAKHLQPDYVKSIPIPPQCNVCIDALLQILEEDTALAQQIYDDELLPPHLIVPQEPKPPTNT